MGIVSLQTLSAYSQNADAAVAELKKFMSTGEPKEVQEFNAKLDDLSATGHDAMVASIYQTLEEKGRKPSDVSQGQRQQLKTAIRGLSLDQLKKAIEQIHQAVDASPTALPVKSSIRMLQDAARQ